MQCRQVIPRLLSGILIIGFLASCTQSPAIALGGAVLHDDPSNPFHIDQLPPDVRTSVLQMCRNLPRAGHYFATYLNNAKLVRLHFEYFQCEDRRQFRMGQNCLRKEFIAIGSHYRIAKTYYAPCEN